MSERTPNLLQRALRLPVEIVVAVYVVMDAIVSLLFRPLIRFLSSLRIVQRIEAGIDSLPPYVILVLMVVPFIFAEFTKVFGLFWMSRGHVRTGMTIFIGAYIVSIFVCERILHAGKRKLMTIAWFAVIYNWIMSIRDHVFGWFRRTWIWQAAIALRQRVGLLLQRIFGRLRAAASRDRSALERR